jgi:hypothetical protein
MEDLKNDILINEDGYYYIILHNKNNSQFKYIVPLYKLRHGVMLEFWDKQFNRFKQLPFAQCEISVQKSTISMSEEIKLKKLYLSQYNDSTRDDKDE